MGRAHDPSVERRFPTWETMEGHKPGLALLQSHGTEATLAEECHIRFKASTTQEAA